MYVYCVLLVGNTTLSSFISLKNRQFPDQLILNRQHKLTTMLDWRTWQYQSQNSFKTNVIISKKSPKAYFIVTTIVVLLKQFWSQEKSAVLF